MYGTVRKDRGLPQASQDDVRAHPLENGEFRWMMTPSDPSPLVVFMWRDSGKNGTPFLSTCHPPTEECEVRRRRGGQNAISKPCPQCASDYNKHMVFFDSCNHIKKIYSTQLNYMYRWYTCFAPYVLELTLINSLVIALLGRRPTGSKAITVCMFVCHRSH